MCGIAGYSARKGLTPELIRLATNKMKILGLANQSRGIHGCGLYINGEIYKGIDDLVTKKNTKEFLNFIGDGDFIMPELDLQKGSISFLHTRMATHGAHTEANTHPFKIKSQDPINDLVGVHNGTLDNIWELCRKYDVDHIGEHIHVDSKALYTLIDKVGLDVLKEYRGMAALLWAKPSEPDTFYVYHGAARKTKADPLVYGERPMFYMHSEEGLYFASEARFLKAIRESIKQEVVELEYNTVFQVTNGNFTDVKVHVAREESNLIPDVVRHYPQQGANCHAGEAYARGGSSFRNLRTIVEETNRTEELRQSRRRGGKAKTHIELATPVDSLVWHETKPKKSLATRDEEVIYFWKGRYHRSGDDSLCKGLIGIKGRGVIKDPSEEIGCDLYWFFRGVLLKNQTAYEAIVEESNMIGSWVNNVGLSSNYAYDISRYAKHAVTHMDGESVEVEGYFKFSWYLDERRVTTKLRPLFSGRCYDIMDGFLVDIVGSNGDDKKTLEPAGLKLIKAEEEEEDAEFDIINAHFGYPSSPLLPAPVHSCAPPTPMRLKDVSIYDIVWDKTQTLMQSLTMEEVEAMASFVEDKLKAENKPHTMQNIQGEMWMSVRTGVAAHKSIREALNDTKSLLDSYLKIVIENKRGVNEVAPWIEIDSTEAAGEEVVQAMMDYYDQYRDQPRRAENEDSPFPDCLGSGEDLEVRAAREENNWDRFIRDTATDEDDERLHDGAFSGEVLDEVLQAQLEEAIENSAKKLNDKMMALQEDEILSAKRLDEVIDVLEEVATIADELQAVDCKLAQEGAYILYRGIDEIKKQMSTLAEDFFCDDLLRRLTQSTSAQ